jgi:Fe-S cluster assembly protein SufD
LLERFGDQSPDSDNGFNLVTQVDIGEGAALHHVRLQVESPRSSLLTDSRIRLGADSLYSYTGVDLGGRSVRHDLRVRLAGEGASSELGGAWVADDEREIDNHVSVEHLAPGAASRQFFRGVLGGRSRGVFNGRALIAAGADGSSVRQSNANLLLSPLAEINAKPELEIYADEVEASHGATVGQLDEDALFYLRSRGLAEPEARQILTAAFCKAPIDRIDPAAITAQDRSVLEDLLHRRMAGVGRSAGE